MRKTSTRGQRQINAVGPYLARLRLSKGLTLREVDEATGNAVSNAYLSQVEHGRIRKPGPDILHSLASLYGASYETLMEKAGYIAPSAPKGEKKGRQESRSITNLTEEEEEELLKYLGWIRFRKKTMDRIG
jgi:transcriptional regulator with XRE-family HTH domain